MLKSARFRLILILTVAIISLIAIAAGLTNLQLGPGEPVKLFQSLSNFRPQGPTSITEGGDIPGVVSVLLQIIRLLIWVGLPGAVIYAIISPRFRKTLLTLLTFLFLFILMIQLLGRREIIEEEEEVVEEGALFGEELGGAEEALPTVPDVVSSPPGWLTAIIVTAVALVIVAVIWFIWRRLRARQPDVSPDVAQIAEQTLADLDRGADVWDAVLGCYTDMIRHLGSNPRHQRLRAMTPREFDTHLARTGLNDAHIHRLTRLFETVRYGRRASDEAMAREARDCLSSIVSTYGGKR